MFLIKVSSVWILITSLSRMGLAEVVGLHQTPCFLSAKSGEAVTLHCSLDEGVGAERVIWYKQRVGQAPQPVGMMMSNSDPTIFSEFSKSGIRLEANRSSISLIIPNTIKDDEGTYFCGLSRINVVEFSTGTFLAVREWNITVLQSLVSQFGVSGSVSPGESVTLQCEVLSEIRAEDLRVLWLRSAAGQSSPEIMFSHQHSRQCEIRSSTNRCVFKFTKNIFNLSDTGTYYCGVDACGTVLFGNGTTVDLAKPVDPVVMLLGGALVICVVVISTQAIANHKRERCCAPDTTDYQAHDAVEQNYTVKRLRMKRGSFSDNVLTEVGYFTFTEHHPNH